jgi:hypothetical protein
MALQSGISLRQPCALDLFKDCGAFGFPAIGRGLEVVVLEVDVDRCDQFVDARKGAFTDDVVGELAKEALDEVEPGGTGRGKVDLNVRMLLQPSADGGMLVRSVVVDDQMQRQPCGRLTMDFFEEGEPLGVRVSRRSGAQNPSVEVVERRKRSGDHGGVCRLVDAVRDRLRRVRAWTLCVFGGHLPDSRLEGPARSAE